MTASDRHPYRGPTVVAVAAALAGVALYLVSSRMTLRLGFPLDDAWIHQTYARNLALRGEWSFVPGAASGGSTAPLWTLLLAIGAWLRLDPRPWAYLLGAASLAGGAVLAVRLPRPGASAGSVWLVGLALLFAWEWHLVWAAASGMEVILLVALVVTILRLSLPIVRRPLLTGAVVGLAMWIRPDAVTLGLIPFLALLLQAGAPFRQRLIGLAWLALGAGLAAAPYLFFNVRTAGTLWPSTFYAKRAEYAELRRAGYGLRYAQLMVAPLTGSGLLLLPGVIVATAQTVRQRRWAELAPVVWAALYLAIFAAWLPVAYQHGRYQMPVLPVLIVVGWQGIHTCVKAAAKAPWRVLARAWALATLAVTLA
ncbi:MAG TPA: hypothetical protein VK449_02190, partial [Anaerolineales bacterium]|nr:hypothetical protein [Anaerolineales bacterium]